MSKIYMLKLLIRTCLTIAVLFGLFNIVVSRDPAPETKLIVSFLCTIFLSIIFLVTSQSSKHDFMKREVLVAFLILLAIFSPTWILYSVVTAVWDLFEVHSISVITVTIVYGVPVIVALFIVDLLQINKSLERGKNLIISVFSVVFLLLLFEIILSVTGLVDKPIPTRTSIDRAVQPSPIEGVRQSYIPNSIWGHRYSSNERRYFDETNTVYYQINSAGYRDDEFSLEREPNSVRIAFLGDSFGAGTGVWHEDEAPVIMEILLSETLGCPVEIYNFSVGGYSTVEQAAILEHVALDYDPDMVIIWYFLNDPQIEGTMSFLGQKETTSIFPVMRDHLNIAKFVFKYLDNLIKTYDMINTYNTIYLNEDVLWQDAKNAFNRMTQLTSARDIPIVLFVHPILFRLNSDYPFSEVHNVIIESAETAGMIAFDLHPPLANYQGQELWVHASDQHANEVAHLLTANYAANNLIELLANKCYFDPNS